MVVSYVVGNNNDAPCSVIQRHECCHNLDSGLFPPPI